MVSILHSCLLLLLFITVEGQTPVCGTNEQYNSCGSSCVESCNYQNKICVKSCIAGCFCKTGYVRQSTEKGSPCIKREACIKKVAIVNTTCVYPRADILRDINDIRSYVSDIGNVIINACGGGDICSRYLDLNTLHTVINDIGTVHKYLGMVHRDIYDCTK